MRLYFDDTFAIEKVGKLWKLVSKVCLQFGVLTVESGGLFTVPPPQPASAEIELNPLTSHPTRRPFGHLGAGH